MTTNIYVPNNVSDELEYISNELKKMFEKDQ